MIKEYNGGSPSTIAKNLHKYFEYTSDEYKKYEDGLRKKTISTHYKSIARVVCRLKNQRRFLARRETLNDLIYDLTYLMEGEHTAQVVTESMEKFKCWSQRQVKDDIVLFNILRHVVDIRDYSEPVARRAHTMAVLPRRDSRLIDSTDESSFNDQSLETSELSPVLYRARPIRDEQSPVCNKCGEGGVLIICHKCGTNYHVHCVDINLSDQNGIPDIENISDAPFTCKDCESNSGCLFTGL